MFLLILLSVHLTVPLLFSLHSTMFLLILVRYEKISYPNCPLHSTMFLLILKVVHSKRPAAGFTFHYVSINTQQRPRRQSQSLTFTFHYVSINTSDRQGWGDRCYAFTFHYVSINTVMPQLTHIIFVSLHSTMFLLIPAPLNHRLILPYYTIFCRP